MDGLTIHTNWTEVAVVVLSVALILFLFAAVVRRRPKGMRALTAVVFGAAVADVVLWVAVLSPQRDYVLVAALLGCLAVTVAAAWAMARVATSMRKAEKI